MKCTPQLGIFSRRIWSIVSCVFIWLASTHRALMKCSCERRILNHSKPLKVKSVLFLTSFSHFAILSKNFWKSSRCFPEMQSTFPYSYFSSLAVQLNCCMKKAFVKGSSRCFAKNSKWSVTLK